MTEVPDGIIYLDTNFFIKAVEGTKETAAPAQKLIEILRQRRDRVAVTSEITFAEVLAPSRRVDALSPGIKRRAYLDLLLWSNLIGLIPVSRSILIETADLRGVTPLKLPDAVHLTSAIQSGCRFFVSTDKDFSRLPTGMVRVNFDEESLSRLIRELS
ncbi:type II toxin-antitoxin system VapC family toxin [uncultured Bradyrhizobium sp.]|uniref:type II toxin-antitoxin system VapC family toxin n=1 Tax=uncultured Bradyrhizobium sp. TaxID=199684 RepID=UPI0035CC373D